MTTEAQTLVPPHQRLAGFSIKHLVKMLSIMQANRNSANPGSDPGFDIWRDDRTSTKAAIIPYISQRYAPHEIDAASKAAVATYGPSKRRPSSGNGQSVPPPDVQHAMQQGGMVPSPAMPNAGDAMPGWQQAPQQSQQQPQSNGVPPPAGNANDPFKHIADGVWPHLKRPVWEVATQEDTLLKRAIADALKQIAATGGTATGTVQVQTVVSLQTPALPELAHLGIQHRKFPQLLKMCNARLRSGLRLNIWLHGPAGTGKTTAAEKVAECLFPDRTLEERFHYNGALSTGFQVLGYMDANGRYVRTAFRDAWERGGVYLFDEIDASMPDALLALNGALANGICPFPDGMVPRHKDCIVIAGANTTGSGGTIEYVGRFKQDAATVDRFVFLDWPLDEGLETALCADHAWTATVRATRVKAKTSGVKGHAITPRASMYGEALLAAGVDRADVIASVLRKGLPNDQWSTIASA